MADETAPGKASSTAARMEALRDAAIAEVPKVCDHRLPCACRRRLIDKFIYVGLALVDQGWTVAP